MRHNLNLNWLRSFEAAARLLSFTAASQEIGLTQTAVSQHIKALESQLGDKLFVRRPKSLLLTDVGKAYLETVQEALSKIEMSTSGLFGPHQARTVEVRASMAVIMWLSPKLGDFQKTHPDVAVKLITSIWKNPADLQAVDVDIVLAPKDHGRPDLDLLADETIVPICCASDRSGVLQVKDMPQLNPIHIMGFDDHWARYLAARGLEEAQAGGKLITDTSTAAIGMVAAGLGCAIVIERFAKQAIEAGQSIRIFGGAVSLGQAHFLAGSGNSPARRPEVIAFENWLRFQFESGT